MTRFEDILEVIQGDFVCIADGEKHVCSCKENLLEKGCYQNHVVSRKLNLFLKRLADIVGSLLGIVILSPVLIIISVVIKLTSKGPVLFLQERLGKNGKTFKIMKFRTMIVDAEHIGEGLQVSSESDPRITKIGRFLRSTSLDELPQFFNVLCGSMSVIGPRPPVTYFPYDGYENYPDWAKKRFEMRPGITGLAQVSVRNSVSWDERIEIDNQYIDHFNIWQDVKIFFLTIKRIIRPQDIYAPSKEAVPAKEVVVRNNEFDAK